jgi:hypothetical protein
MITEAFLAVFSHRMTDEEMNRFSPMTLMAGMAALSLLFWQIMDAAKPFWCLGGETYPE